MEEFLLAAVLAMTPGHEINAFNPINSTHYRARLYEESSVLSGIQQSVLDVHCVDLANQEHWSFGYIHRRNVFKPLAPVESWDYDSNRKTFEW